MRVLWLAAVLSVLTGPAFAAGQWTDFATISATAPLASSRLCYSDGRDIACNESAGLLYASGTVVWTTVSATNISVTNLTINGEPYGNAEGDRIVSNSLVVIANGATNYVSLSTGLTTWGYFSSVASYLPVLTAGLVSSTNASITTLHISSRLGVGTTDPSETFTVSGTAWITRAGFALIEGGDVSDTEVSATDSRIGSIVASKWCVANGGGTGLDCVSDAPVLVEVDPKVGSLTNTKWCTTDGTTVTCTTDVPVLTEVDPEVGTLTNGKWCTTDGTTVTCATDAPVTAAAGANTQVQYNNNGAFAGSAGLTWTEGTSTLAATNIAGIIATAAQPNITSLGVLTSLGVAGTITATTVSATNVYASSVSGSAGTFGALTVNGQAITGGIGDRIVSGTAYVKAVENTGAEISGTLTVVNTGNEPCTGGNLGAHRVNPATGKMQFCGMR